ncbi:hypothetical protein [Lentzea sp. NPDC059081]|uniref:hypothetical protein n=1 Tax=Lentzea sp. NPDC059081 TaxID=3346719 RepID=UPI0036D1B291
MTNPLGSTQACAVHPDVGRRALSGYRVCEPCLREGMTGLDDIERIAWTLWSDPDSLLPHRGSDSGRGSTSHKSSPPLNLSVVALTDWRSIASSRGEPDDFEMVVHYWSDKISSTLGVFYPTPARGQWPAVMVLRRWWHWACKQDFAGPLVWDMTNVATLLRDVAQENRGKAKLGRCPERLGGERCGFLLMVRPDADHLTCPRCGTGWPKLGWRRLAFAIAAADAG